MTEIKKRFISPNELFSSSIKLGTKIVQTGWKPNFIIALWRGGSVPGMCVQEVLEYSGIPVDHIAVRTSSYVGMQQQKEIRVHGLHYIIENVNKNDKVLIVDDIFESGRSIEAVISELKTKMRENFPQDIKVATLFVKTGKNKTQRNPDFFVENTDEWIVFPHEFEGLTRQQVQENKVVPIDLFEYLDEKEKKSLFAENSIF